MVLILFILMSDNLFSVVFFGENHFVFNLLSSPLSWYSLSSVLCDSWSFDHFQGSLPLHDFLSSFSDFFCYYLSQCLFSGLEMEVIFQHF